MEEGYSICERVRNITVAVTYDRNRSFAVAHADRQLEAEPVVTINPEVIVCNIKKRFTGVSGTINALVPVQARSLSIAYLGTPIPGATLAQAQSPAALAARPRSAEMF